MKLNRTASNWTSLERNKINENWDIIEGLGGKVNNIVDEISDEAFNKIVDSAKLNWKEPVDTVADLPSGADEGDARMVRDSGKVYRYDGAKWVEIQEIDATAINEVDARLTEQLAQTVNYLKESFVNVKMFGAVGDSVIDDTDAINNAFLYAYQNGGSVYFPKGEYLITSPIGEPIGISSPINIGVIGAEGSKIISSPSTEIRYVLFLQSQNIKRVSVSGLEIDGTLKTRAGIFIRSTNEPIELAVVSDNRVYNMHGSNAGGSPSNVTGIYIQSVDGGKGIAEVKNNEVYNVTRDTYGGGMFCSGITVTRFQNFVIDNNIIEKVLIDENNEVDADGIRVYSSRKISTNIRLNSAATIMNNTIKNCSGRFVKLQTNGQAIVKHNMFSIEGEIHLINDFTGVDSQVGSAQIEENHFHFGDGWTGAGSGKLSALQEPVDIDYVGDNFFQSFSGNKGTLRKRLPYGVIPIFRNSENLDFKIHFKINRNELYNHLPLTTTTQSGDFAQAVRVFVYQNSIRDILGNVTIEISENRVLSYDFIRLLMHSNYINNDLTNKLFLIVEDNVKFPNGYSRQIIHPETGVVKTSSIKVKNNMIGSAGGLWGAPFDIFKIMSGSSFYVPSTTDIENRPPGFGYGVVNKEGTHYFCYSSNGAWVGSGDSGWTSLTN